MDEFDITEFAKMFDAALASDNPSVKKALRNFMMVAAIVHAEDGDEVVAGPLETLITKVNHLESMIRELQNNRAYKDNYYKDYYRNDPTWMYNTNMVPYISTTQSTMYPSSVDVDDAMIKQLMKDLKFDDK